jgi:hypothetical protein
MEEGQTSFERRDLLIAIWPAVPAHGSGRNRIKLPPNDRLLLARVTERMRAEYDANLRLEGGRRCRSHDLQLIGLFKAGRADAACLSDPDPAQHGLPLSSSCARLADGERGRFYDQSALNKHLGAATASRPAFAPAPLLRRR